MRWPWSKRDADLLAYEGGLVTIATNVDARAHDEFDVQAHLPGGEQFDARLAVVHEIEPDLPLDERRQELGYAPSRHLYCARLVKPLEIEDHLAVLLESLPGESDHHHRVSKRVDCCLRVSGPDLPHYQGLTRDLSATGLSLVTDGPLRVGAEIPLRLEFGRSPFELEVTARIRWSQSSLMGVRHASHESGLAFVNLTDLEREGLDKYLTAVQSEAGLWDDSRYHW